MSIFVGNSLYVAMELAQKESRKSFYGVIYSRMVVVRSVFKSPLVDMGKDLASGL